jgi:hypothetical protein
MAPNNNVRWDSSSNDARALREAIENGQITSDMTPKQVQEMYPQFRKYPNNSFSGNLCRYCQLFGNGGQNNNNAVMEAGRGK